MSDVKTASRAWMRQQSRVGRRGALPVVVLGMLGTALAIGQAACAGFALQAALRPEPGTDPLLLLAGFAGLAVLRAGLSVASERAAFEAGATARRRLRTDALIRLLAAGPSLLRRRHSGELTSVVVDRIEAVDGLFARWMPASTLAIAAPALVLLAALLADPAAALVLGLCGLLVPVAMALSGIGAAVASKRQFAAMAHLQARFLDRVRGIATIVMHGRAGDEATALARAADELRRRTMRVLRVAFLSSVSLDLAMALAMIVIALRYGSQSAAGRLASPAARHSAWRSPAPSSRTPRCCCSTSRPCISIPPPRPRCWTA